MAVESLEQLLHQPGLWRGRQRARLRTEASGFDQLDEILPGGGWPQGALSELLLAQAGIGELQLLIPLLARLSQQSRSIVLLAPPYLPYPPALAQHGVDTRQMLLIRDITPQQTLWASEQCLRSGHCAAVLCWLQGDDVRPLRRLQLAAEAGQGLAFAFRDIAQAAQASPAALRLKLSSQPPDLCIETLKLRGGWAHQGLIRIPRVADSLPAPAKPVPPSNVHAFPQRTTRAGLNPG